MTKLHVVLSLLIALAPATRAPAQTVFGRLVNQDEGTPLNGAVVHLMVAPGNRVFSTFTDANGGFVLAAPAEGRYWLRAELIGYQASESPPFHLAAGDTLAYRLAMPVQAVDLGAIVATAERRCVVRPSEGQVIANVWEEVRKALAAAELTAEGGVYRFDVARYSRRLGPDLEVRNEDRSGRSAYLEQPFVSLPATELFAGGFVQEREGGKYYYAPDAATLLSDDFLDTHCFTPATSAGDSLIGIDFRPVRDREVPDIRGTFWVDRETSELRLLDYEYTGENLGISAAGSGRVEYRRMPAGTWVIRRWWIRMPVVGEGVGVHWMDVRKDIAGFQEDGGEVIRVRDMTGRVLATTEWAALAGTVLDSTTMRPLAGATVRMEGTRYETVTDSTGGFLLDELPEGRYRVTFAHPRLDDLAVASIPAAPVTLASSDTVVVHLAIPPLETLLASACEAQGRTDPHRRGTVEGERTGVLAGTVRDRDGTPLQGAEVFLLWSRYDLDSEGNRVGVVQQPWATSVSTDHFGRYVACGVPANISINARALLPGLEGDTATVRVPADGVVRLDLTMEVTNPAMVLGRMIDGETGTAISGVAIQLVPVSTGDDDARSVVTDTDGRFVVDGVLPGRYAMTTSHVAYGTRTDTLEAGPGEAVHVEMALDQQAIELAAIHVTAHSRLEEARRVAGTPLRVLTRQDIARIASTAKNVGDIVRNLPGTLVTGGWYTKNACIQASRRNMTMRSSGTTGCDQVLVFVDGVRIGGDEFGFVGEYLTNLDVDQIESIEFLNPSEATFRFGTEGGEGALLIYTRGNGPFARPK